MARLSAETRARWESTRDSVLPLLGWAAAVAVAGGLAVLLAPQSWPLASITLLGCGAAATLLQRTAAIAVVALRGGAPTPRLRRHTAILGAVASAVIQIAGLSSAAALAAWQSTGQPLWLCTLGVTIGVAGATASVAALGACASGAGIGVIELPSATRSGALRRRAIPLTIIVITIVAALIVAHPPALVLAPPIAALTIAASALRPL